MTESWTLIVVAISWMGITASDAEFPSDVACQNAARAIRWNGGQNGVAYCVPKAQAERAIKGWRSGE